MGSVHKSTLGGGCFWCVEAAFKQINGTDEVVSGYSGGDIESPTYKQVCSGTTDHAEVVQVTYDPDKITYKDILSVFFSIHDPTQVNRQGPDVGPQYRSIILYHSEDQRQTAESTVDKLESSGDYEKPIATELKEFDVFYPAEDYHQDYFEKNPNQAYCRSIIPPKLNKLQQNHRELLKED